MNKSLIASILALEFFALPVQYILLLSTTGLSVFEATVRFYSYFTILTNSLVAVCCAVLIFSRESRALRFFQKTTTLTAITVYILIVGLVYNIILRPLSNFQGFHLVVSEIFHTVVPLAFLIHWVMYVPQVSIPWRSIFLWMIYPLVYMIYTVIHGAYSDFYPYPFINVTQMGYASAMINALFVLVAFLAISIMMIVAARFRASQIDRPR